MGYDYDEFEKQIESPLTKEEEKGTHILFKILIMSSMFCRQRLLKDRLLRNTMMNNLRIKVKQVKLAILKMIDYIFYFI
jgi:hypothetical protein